jgi:hypothetical protein
MRRNADGVPTHAAQVLGGLLTGVGLAARDHDAGAGEHEAFRQRQADAAGPARHDDGAVGHVEEGVERRAVHARQ